MRDRNEIREALSRLTPEQHRAAEDLFLEKILREANERDRARDPEGFRVTSEHAAAVAATLPNPLPPGASEAIRQALATVARAILTGESGDASDGA